MRLRAIAATTVLVAALSGCGAAEDSPAPTSPAPTSESTTAGPSAGPSHDPLTDPTPVQDLTEYEPLHEEPTAYETPSWGDASLQSAQDFAVQVIETYFDTSGTPEDWWERVGPLLTDNARLVYVNVDPTNAPALTVTGPGVVTDTTSAYVTEVTVPTSLGNFGVVIQRADADDPWAADRLVFPEGLH